MADCNPGPANHWTMIVDAGLAKGPILRNLTLEEDRGFMMTALRATQQLLGDDLAPVIPPRLLFRLTIPGPAVTKKNHGEIVCIDKGTRCPTCRLPQRRVCPTCRRARDGRHVVQPSPEFRRWEAAARPEIHTQLAQQGHAMATGPVHVRALIYRDSDRSVGDLSGYLDAIGDVLQPPKGKDFKARFGSLLVPILDDKQIDSWDGSRRLWGPPARVEIEIFDAGTQDYLVPRLELPLATASREARQGRHGANVPRKVAEAGRDTDRPVKSIVVRRVVKRRVAG